MEIIAMKKLLKNIITAILVLISTQVLNANVDYIIYTQNPAQPDIHASIQPVDSETYRYIQEHYLVKYQFPMSTATANKPFIEQLSEPEQRQLCEDERTFIKTKLQHDPELIRHGLADKIHLLPIPTTLYELFLLSKTTPDEFYQIAEQMRTKMGPTCSCKNPYNSLEEPKTVASLSQLSLFLAYFRNFIRIDRESPLLNFLDKIEEDPIFSELQLLPKPDLLSHYLDKPNNLNNARHEIYRHYVDLIEYPINFDFFIYKIQSMLNIKLIDYIKHKAPQFFVTKIFNNENIEAWIADNRSTNPFFYRTPTGEGCPASLRLNQKTPALLNTLKQFTCFEYQHQDHFILWRGTNGLTKQDGAFYIDQLHKESFGLFNHLSYLSYGNSIFSGSILDKSASPAYHFWLDKIAYGLKINKYNYLFNPESIERKFFFVTPLSTIAGLFGILEHFHSQTLIFTPINPRQDKKLEADFQNYIERNGIVIRTE